MLGHPIGGRFNRSLSLGLKLLLLSVLWVCGIIASLFLLYICAPIGQSLADQAPAPPPQTAPTLSDQHVLNESLRSDLTELQRIALANEVNVAKVESRLGELGKRIEESSAHATRVISVIGFLIGVFSLLVAIGLWHSKEYIDRVVSSSEVALKRSIEKETSLQMERFSENANAQAEIIKEIDKKNAEIVNSLEEFDVAFRSRFQAIGHNMSRNMGRAAGAIFSELPIAFDNGLAVAVRGGVIGEQTRSELRDELEKLTWKQGQLVRSLILLNSDKPSDVLTGCQMLSTFGTRDHLNLLEDIRSKWDDESRILFQIQKAYETISSKVSTKPVETDD